MTIFDFDGYKDYLRSYQAQLPRGGYGFKSRLAEAAGCRTAYVAQVLGGDAHFSAEQAESVNAFLRHKDSEAEFFLLQVQLARAGTQSLRARVRRRMEALRSGQLNLKQRFQATTELGEKELYEFFGRWYINAVQLAAGIPRLKSRKALAKALALEESTLNEALDFLKSHNLLTENNGRLEPGNTRIFIGQDSPTVLRLHHANWRQRAIHSLDIAGPKDLHFTSVYSLSAKDAALIRERFIREIEHTRKVVKESPEEELHTLGIDFFRVDRF